MLIGRMTNKVFIHVKSGNRYCLIGSALNSGTLEPYVVYQSITASRGIPAGTLWVRDLNDFNRKFNDMSTNLSRVMHPLSKTSHM